MGESQTEPSQPARRPASRILAEGALILFAVLAALAVDEWWEDRENAELAVRATETIAAEMRENRSELQPDEDTPELEALLESLESAIEIYESGDRPDNVGVSWNVALLSSAAWETARITRATQFMPMDQVVQLAQVYEFQEFYGARQDELVTLISDLEGQIDDDPVAAIKVFRGRYRIAHTLRETLDTIYACTLRDLELATADETADCEAGSTD